MYGYRFEFDWKKTVAAYLVSSFIVLLLGCSPPPTDLLHPVSGQVTFAGKPLTTGTVSFRPDVSKGNQSLHHPTGVIGPDGKFTLFTAAKPGAARRAGIRRWSMPMNRHSIPAGPHPGLPKSLIPVRYSGSDTPLSREVLENPPPGAYDLELESRL